MLARPLLCLMLGCGRVAFDPVGEQVGTDDGGGGSGDGGTGSDGSATSDALMIDAPPSACTFALTLQPGVPQNVNTCTGRNQIDGCGGTNSEEVMFKFTVPTSGGYAFRARDAGTQNVSHMTGIMNAGCTATTNCAGIMSSSYTAGQILYFIVEATPAGGCAQIEFENF